MRPANRRKATEADLWQILRNAAGRYGVKERSELAALTLALRAILDIAPDRLEPPKQRKRSYSSKWSYETCGRLLTDVRDEIARLEKAKRPKDLRTVCRILEKREPWASLIRDNKQKAELLRQKYTRMTAGWKKMQAAMEAKDWDKFFDLWEHHAQRGEWAGVDVWANDEGDIQLVPFKAEYKDPKLPLRSRNEKETAKTHRTDRP